MSKLLREAGAKPVELPLIEFRTIIDHKVANEFLSDLESYNWLLFTSANAIEIFFEFVDADRLHSSKIKLACVGRKTAKVLERTFRAPDFVPNQNTSEYLADQIEVSPGEKILLPCPVQSNPLLPEKLREKGATVVTWPIYETVQLDLSAEMVKTLEDGVEAVTFASPSAIDSFCDRITESDQLLKKSVVACIGPMTKQRAEERDVRVDVMPETYDIPNLVRALAEFFEEQAS